MPAPTEITIPIEEIKICDTLDHPTRAIRVEVADITHGPKWITVKTTSGNGTGFRLLRGMNVEVTRMMTTPEERAAAEHKFLEREVRDAAETLVTWSEIDMQAEQADILSKYGEHGFCDSLSWGGAELVTLAVRRYAGHLFLAYTTPNEEGTSTVHPPAEALIALEATLRDEAIRLAKRGSSRSTSMWHNLVEDTRREALFELIDTFGGIGRGVYAARQLIEGAK